MRVNYEQLTKIWRASARDSQLTRDDLSSVEIDDITAALLDSAGDMSLRAEGHFVYGISQIWNGKAELLLQDSRKTDENIGTAFREYLQALVRFNGSSQSSEPDRRATTNTDLELPDILTIPESLLSSGSMASRASGEGDLSIDAVMRSGDADMEDELSEGENVMRTAEDREALEGIDLGIDEPLGGGGMDDEEPGNLDFGSDLAYSSSPPHTPRGSDELQVDINGGSSPQVREVSTKTAQRRRRGAPIDDVTTIVRPRKPLPKILRNPPTFGLTEEAESAEEEDEDSYIPLDEATEKFLDPDFVQDEMRRRRRVEAGDMDVDEEDNNDDSIELGNLDLEDNELDFGDIGDDYAEEEEEEEEDTLEMVETEQRKAREAIKQTLRRKGDKAAFDDLASSSKAKASTLLEVLGLAARGKLRAEQEEAWGSINVIKV